MSRAENAAATDRYRGRMRRIVLPLLAAAITLTACNGEPEAAPSPSATAEASTATEPAQVPTSEAIAEVGCEPAQDIPIQGQGHLVGDQEPPVPYNSTPPTSGWHASGDVPIEIDPEGPPLSEPEQVTVLELGGIVVSFDQLPADELTALTDFLTERFEGQVALTRYRKLEPGQVALTGWGVLQQCTGVDRDAITTFVEEHVER